MRRFCPIMTASTRDTGPASILENPVHTRQSDVWEPVTLRVRQCDSWIRTQGLRKQPTLHLEVRVRRSKPRNVRRGTICRPHRGNIARGCRNYHKEARVCLSLPSEAKAHLMPVAGGDNSRSQEYGFFSAYPTKTASLDVRHETCCTKKNSQPRATPSRLIVGKPVGRSRRMKRDAWHGCYIMADGRHNRDDQDFGRETRCITLRANRRRLDGIAARLQPADWIFGFLGTRTLALPGSAEGYLMSLSERTIHRGEES